MLMEDKKDWINELLPDCVLSSIFWLLPIKDVVSTIRLVCRRWMQLALPSVQTKLNLEFDVENIFGYDPNFTRDDEDIGNEDYADGDSRNEFVRFVNKIFGYDPKFTCDDEDIGNEEYEDGDSRDEFVRCVNKVLEVHHGNKLHSFKVAFFLDKESTSDLDEWIRFAIRKKVQVLDLHLFSCRSRQEFEESKYYYVLPCGILSDELKEKEDYHLNNLSLHRCELRIPSGFDGFNQLTSLFLYNVVVDRVSTQRLFSDCFFNLETLTFYMCDFGCSNLVLDSPSLVRLKNFIVADCQSISRVDISLPQLAYLELRGGIFDISISPPYPPRICYYPQEKGHMDNALTQFASYHGLRYLYLDSVWKDEQQTIPRYTFRDLKELVYNLAGDGTNLIRAVNLLKAAPFLEQVVITFCLHTFCKDEQVDQWRRVFSGFKHHHLRKVTLQGFQSSPEEIEFATFILQNTTMLEMMVIDPFGQEYDGRGVFFNLDDHQSISSWEEKGRPLVQENLEEVMSDAQITIL